MSSRTNTLHSAMSLPVARLLFPVCTRPSKPKQLEILMSDKFDAVRPVCLFFTSELARGVQAMNKDGAPGTPRQAHIAHCNDRRRVRDKLEPNLASVYRVRMRISATAAQSGA